MFEHTLVGTSERDGRVHLGPISFALALHAAAAAAIVAASLLALRTVTPPEPPLIFQLPSPPPSPDAGGPPPRGTPAARRPAAGLPARPAAPRLVQPERTPDLVPIVELPEDPGGETLGIPGTGVGVIGGTGVGTGEGTGIGDGGIYEGPGSEPIEVGPSVVAPRLVVRVQPDYPRLAQTIRLEGRVFLRAVIGPDGTVEAAEVVRSTNRMFDDAALEAVRKWRYLPATQSGRPVSVWFDVVVDFVLR